MVLYADWSVVIEALLILFLPEEEAETYRYKVIAIDRSSCLSQATQQVPAQLRLVIFILRPLIC
jgi:hypothetical protein